MKYYMVEEDWWEKVQVVDLLLARPCMSLSFQWVDKRHEAGDASVGHV